MFFILSKILWFIIIPFNFIFILFLIGWLLLFKRPKSGKKLLGFVLLLLFIFGVDLMPNFLHGLLENRIIAGNVPNTIDGIIVLAGMVDMEASRPGLIELTAQSDRIITGIIMAREHPEAKLIITGGSGSMKQDDSFREADYLKKLVLSLGIREERILIERNSRNTHEHAIEMHKMLSSSGRWVLVTSAFHMPRSYGSFKKEGLDVIPYPVDYKTKLDKYNKLALTWFLPTSGNISRFGVALHEWLGLIAYRLMGYTDVLFPIAD